MKLFSSAFMVLFFVVSNVFAAGAPQAEQKCSEPQDKGAAACNEKTTPSYEEKKAHHAHVLNSLFPTKTADRSFSQIPVTPEATSPAFLAAVDKTVTLKWTETYGSDSYHLQVATDPNFKWLVVNEKFIKDTSYVFTAPEADKKYYWRVAGRSSTNIPGYSKSNFAGSVFVVK